MSAAAKQRLSADAYLAQEAQAQTKSEYVAGEVFAMVGVSPTHNRLALNLSSALLRRLHGQPCQVFISDVKLRVEAADAYFYPDVFVTCGAAVPGKHAAAATDAQLVVEVLSPGTEHYDRGAKLRAYRQLPSLQEYVLVSQDERRVEIYRRGGDLGWGYQSLERDEVLTLASVGHQLPLAELYEGADVP